MLNEYGLLTRDFITLNYDFDVRQTNYYTDAGRYLGLIDKKIINREVNYYLTDLGKSIFTSNINDRQIKFIELILSHRVFNLVMKSYFENLEQPNRDKIVELMKTADLYNITSDSTFERRSSTISSWINWVFDQVEE